MSQGMGPVLPPGVGVMATIPPYDPAAREPDAPVDVVRRPDPAVRNRRLRIGLASAACLFPVATAVAAMHTTPITYATPTSAQAIVVRDAATLGIDAKLVAAGGTEGDQQRLAAGSTTLTRDLSRAAMDFPGWWTAVEQAQKRVDAAYAKVVSAVSAKRANPALSDQGLDSSVAELVAAVSLGDAPTDTGIPRSQWVFLAGGLTCAVIGGAWLLSRRRGDRVNPALVGALIAVGATTYAGASLVSTWSDMSGLDVFRQARAQAALSVLAETHSPMALAERDAALSKGHALMGTPEGWPGGYVWSEFESTKIAGPQATAAQLTARAQALRRVDANLDRGLDDRHEDGELAVWLGGFMLLIPTSFAVGLTASGLRRKGASNAIAPVAGGNAAPAGQAGSVTHSGQAGSVTHSGQAGPVTHSGQAGSVTHSIQAGPGTHSGQAGSVTHSIQAGPGTHSIQETP